jgi:hypothetical protein
MQRWDDRLFAAVYGLFGAFLGFLVYLFAFGGFLRPLFRSTRRGGPGWIPLLFCAGIAAIAGVYAYVHRKKEFGGGFGDAVGGSDGAVLFTKRLLVIGVAFAGLYFLWQFAHGR